MHCKRSHAICSLTFDQSCLASFESCFDVVSLKMAGVTKIKFVVEGVKRTCEYLNHTNRHQQEKGMLRNRRGRKSRQSELRV